MKKTYTLVGNTTVEVLDGDELLARMKEVEENGWHIEESTNEAFDFMICYW